jgi:large subunit ribosomal protein L21
MRYAMFESGGKQYVARKGETVEVDHLALNVGVKAEFKEVLLVSDGDTVEVGTPYVDGAMVSGKVVGQIRAPKVIVFKYIPKERYRRKKGHRQQYTKVEIQEIVIPGAAPEEPEPVQAETPVEAVDQAPRTRKAATKKKTAKKSSAKKTKVTTEARAKKSAAKKSTAKKSSAKKSSAKKSAGKKSAGKE